MDSIWGAVVTGGVGLVGALVGSLSPIWVSRATEASDRRRKRSEEILERIERPCQFFYGTAASTSGTLEQVTFPGSFHIQMNGDKSRLRLIAPTSIVKQLDKCGDIAIDIHLLLEDEKIQLARVKAEELRENTRRLIALAREYAMIK